MIIISTIHFLFDWRDWRRRPETVGSNGGCNSLTSNPIVTKLVNVEGNYYLGYWYQNTTGLTSIEYTNLETLKGNYVMYYAHSGCTNLTSASFPSCLDMFTRKRETPFNS